MGIKVDCIPGRITHTIFSSFALGVFYGQCSELCGPLHGFMPICVEVIPFN
jgi:cytochrome c oxidase subunit 2